LLSIIKVSVKTVTIAKGLPKVDFGTLSEENNVVKMDPNEAGAAYSIAA
jgi:hypothetical protein